MLNKRRALRLYGRLGCFLLAIILLLPLSSWIGLSRVFVQASSFVALCTILAGGAFLAPSILGLVFSIISLARKRQIKAPGENTVNTSILIELCSCP
jgi:hypothetical protein